MTTNEAIMKEHVEEAIIKILNNYGTSVLEHGFHPPSVRKAVNELSFVRDLKFGLHGMEVRFCNYLYNIVAGDCSEKIYNEFEAAINKLGWVSEERDYATVYYSPIPLTA